MDLVQFGASDFLEPFAIRLMSFNIIQRSTPSITDWTSRQCAKETVQNVSYRVVDVN